MKILMVSWEYPPVVIGGLGRHVHHLSTALAAAGHDVVVLSRRPTGTDPSTHPSSDEINENVRVVAAAQDPHEFAFGSDMMAWTLAMGHAMVRAGLSLKDRRSDRRGGPTWCTRTTGWSPILRSLWPNFTTCQWFPRSMRPRPAGTPGWVSGSLSRQVHAVESWLVRESDSLITCSASMSEEITELFGPGLAETTVIRNGIEAARWPFARRRPRTGPPELLIRGPAGVREGRARGDRRAATDPAGPPRRHPDHRRRRHPAGLARRAGP